MSSVKPMPSFQIGVLIPEEPLLSVVMMVLASNDPDDPDFVAGLSRLLVLTSELSVSNGPSELPRYAEYVDSPESAE